MRATFISGGDPTSGTQISIKNYSSISENFLQEILDFFPNLKPAKFGKEVPTELFCCWCRHSLVWRNSLEEILALTHIYSSLRIYGGRFEGIYLLCNDCQGVIQRLLAGGTKEINDLKWLISRINSLKRQRERLSYDPL